MPFSVFDNKAEQKEVYPFKNLRPQDKASGLLEKFLKSQRILSTWHPAPSTTSVLL